MELEKFEKRTLHDIESSLHIQHLEKDIEPIRLLNWYDRYFLVECSIRGKRTKVIFLRYDKWYFYLHGMTKLPRKHSKRKYTYIHRGKKHVPRRRYKSIISEANREKIIRMAKEK